MSWFGKVNMEQNLVVDGLDISKLDDDELYKRLSDLGATVGPIVESTRKVYQKKLLVLMGGDVPDSPTYNGDLDEEYSDSEDAEEVKVEEVVTSKVENTTSPPPSEVSDIRRRVLLSSAGETNRGEVVFDPEKHTPSPRRSLRSVTSTKTTTTYESTIFRNVNNGRSELINATASPTKVSTEEEDDDQEQDRKSKISLIVRLLVKLLFLGLIVALILYIYQNDPSESPFKAVEQLARQALEAAVGEEANVKEEGTVESVEAPDTPPQLQEVPEVH
ncbi:lamina-associated polypeptide 2, isoforms alpha/zeta-like isoform X2 [Macrobrachium rosenbergii]|uniref:lamina-associated polypeptide 2, isoforms alpha/zeta-like isoform X2 n=1 Tax=Macrobrachium rosenbergii TaxID=79674 RepID=UPI0034D636D0